MLSAFLIALLTALCSTSVILFAVYATLRIVKPEAFGQLNLQSVAAGDRGPVPVGALEAPPTPSPVEVTLLKTAPSGMISYGVGQGKASTLVGMIQNAVLLGSVPNSRIENYVTGQTNAFGLQTLQGHTSTPGVFIGSGAHDLAHLRAIRNYLYHYQMDVATVDIPTAVLNTQGLFAHSAKTTVRAFPYILVEDEIEQFRIAWHNVVGRQVKAISVVGNVLAPGKNAPGLGASEQTEFGVSGATDEALCGLAS
jgi:hypothetical protein